MIDPLEYPGSPVRTTGVLTRGRVEPVPVARWDGVLADLGAAPTARRTAVLAVGSNADMAVLQAKLGADAVVPVSAVTVHGLAVGHSAHVSRRGYVAAAPFDRPGATTRCLAQWLDGPQLAALDATEPNYRRITLDPHRYRTDHGDRSQRFEVYESSAGLLRLDGRPVPLTSQHELHALLRATPLAGWPANADDAATALVALADPAVQERLRRCWNQQGLAGPSGLLAEN